MNIEWGTLDGPQAQTEVDKLKTGLEALVAKKNAADADEANPKFLPEDTKRLAELTAELVAGQEHIASIPDVDEAMKAANEILAPPVVEDKTTDTPDTPAVEDKTTDTSPSADDVAKEAAEGIKALEAELADKETELAQARAAIADGETNNTDIEEKPVVEVSARAALQVYDPNTGTMSSDLSVQAIASAATHALNGGAKVVLASTQLAPADTPMVTGENEGHDFQVILDAQAAHVEYLEAQAACEGDCGDLAPLINQPAELFTPKPTPFMDRAVKVPVSGGCAVKAFRPVKPMTDDEFFTYVVCHNWAADPANDPADYGPGWRANDGTMTRQNDTNGVPDDKPVELLDPSCFKPTSYTLEAPFYNAWIRESDQLCSPRQVAMTLRRKIALYEAQTERKFMDSTFADMFAEGHTYSFTANTDRDAAGEFGMMLNDALPGEVNDWYLDLSRFTPVWSQGMAQWLGLGSYRSGGRSPRIAEVLQDAGVNFANGFESQVPMTNGGVVPAWKGEAATEVNLSVGGTPGPGVNPASDSKTHALWLVDFSSVADLTGLRREVTLDNSPSARVKNSAFFQIERYDRYFPIGGVTGIGFKFTGCPNGTLSAEKDFVCA